MFTVLNLGKGYRSIHWAVLLIFCRFEIFQDKKFKKNPPKHSAMSGSNLHIRLNALEANSYVPLGTLLSIHSDEKSLQWLAPH